MRSDCALENGSPLKIGVLSRALSRQTDQLACRLCFAPSIGSFRQRALASGGDRSEGPPGPSVSPRMVAGRLGVAWRRGLGGSLWQVKGASIRRDEIEEAVDQPVGCR